MSSGSFQEQAEHPLFGLIGCFCDHCVVYLLPHQTHTWTNWCITFRTKRNSLCLPDIFHRIFFSTVRTVILINTAMQINHILTSCSLRQTKNTSCDNCLKNVLFLPALPSPDILFLAVYQGRLTVHYDKSFKKSVVFWSNKNALVNISIY